MRQVLRIKGFYYHLNSVKHFGSVEEELKESSVSRQKRLEMLRQIEEEERAQMRKKLEQEFEEERQKVKQKMREEIEREIRAEKEAKEAKEKLKLVQE